MSGSLLKQYESLRICFREKCPGVCVRDPYTRDVWTDPEAPCVREAMKMGIPLAVKIEGPGANGFTLDVTGPVGTSHGGDSARCQGKGIMLDLTTGSAEGHIVVRYAAHGREPVASAREISTASLQGTSPQRRSEPDKRGGLECDHVSLLIAFAPEWEARINRPVLCLRSPPARVWSPGDGGDDCGSSAKTSPESRSELNFCTSRVACNVRQLRFAVQRGSSHGSSKAVPCAASVISELREHHANFDINSAGCEVINLEAVESASLGGYFGKVWDCSLVLASFLSALGPQAVGGKRVVELGAGCGIVSALCATLGAAEVVATDTRDLLPLLKLNVAYNCCTLRLRNIKIEEYEWGSKTATEALAGEFDVILCSDLLYDPAYWPALLSCFAEFGGADTVVYMAHRLRNPQEERFFRQLQGSSGYVGKFQCTRLLPKDGQDIRPTASGSGGGVWRWDAFPDVALYKLWRPKGIDASA